MYEKILVPLDGSELAECVFPHVEALARGCQVKRIILSRVVEPFKQPAAAEYVFDAQEVENVNAEMRAEAERYLEKAKGKFQFQHPGVTVEAKVAMGRVAETLASQATENAADLIVIATHGRSGVSRWVWGSVADRILRSSCVPVLMVRAPGCIPGV